MKGLRILLLLLVCLPMGFDCWGQDGGVCQTYCKKVPETGDRITEIWTDGSPLMPIKSFSNRLADDTLKTGRYVGLRVAVFESGLMVGDSLRILLPGNETLLDYQGDHLVTLAKSYETYVSTLRKYQVTNNGLQFLKSKEFKHADIFFYRLGNGNLLLSDEHEGQGFVFEIYSDDFELLAAYVPFQKGFQQAATDIRNGTLTMAVKPLDKGENIKLICLDTNTGKTISEHSIGRNDFRVSALHASEDANLIYGSQKLLATDQNGRVRWEKDVTILHDLMAVGGGRAYAISQNNRLVCLDMENGGTLWQKDIFGEYPYPEKTVANGKLQKIARPIVMEALFGGEMVGLAIGQIPLNYLNAEDVKYMESEFYVFDKWGRIQTAISLGGIATTIRIISNPSDFTLITNTETHRYENCD